MNIRMQSKNCVVHFFLSNQFTVLKCWSEDTRSVLSSNFPAFSKFQKSKNGLMKMSYKSFPGSFSVSFSVKNV